MAFYLAMGGGESIPYIAPDYDSSIEYNKEDVVLYDNEVYMCNTNGTTGTWDSTKWNKKYLSELTEYNSNLGGKVKCKLLWSNTNLSSFSPQDISIDLSSYKYVLIEHSTSNDNQILSGNALIKVGESNYGIGASTYTYSAGLSRNVSVSSTSVHFYDEYNGTSVDNRHIIPTRIWGIKDEILDSSNILYTNPSPTSKIATALVSADTSKYNAFVAECNTNYSSSYSAYKVRGIFYKNGSVTHLGGTASTVSAIRGYYATSDGIGWTPGIWSTYSNGHNDEVVIPVTVYGIPDFEYEL